MSTNEIFNFLLGYLFCFIVFVFDGESLMQDMKRIIIRFVQDIKTDFYRLFEAKEPEQQETQEEATEPQETDSPIILIGEWKWFRFYWDFTEGKILHTMNGHAMKSSSFPSPFSGSFNISEFEGPKRIEWSGNTLKIEGISNIECLGLLVCLGMEPAPGFTQVLAEMSKH